MRFKNLNTGCVSNTAHSVFQISSSIDFWNLFSIVCQKKSKKTQFTFKDISQGLKNVIFFVSFSFVSFLRIFCFVSFLKKIGFVFFVSLPFLYIFYFPTSGVYLLRQLRQDMKIIFRCFNFYLLEKTRRDGKSKIHLAFKNTMSDGQVPLAQSKEKMSFTIKKSRFTLTLPEWRTKWMPSD
jgi:hypothetical protein